MVQKLYDISWQVDEETYRADPALSYSTLARFAREGFNKLDSLFDKLETPSLTFGSAVDAIITGGMTEFESRFLVAEYPPISESVLKIVKVLFEENSATHHTLTDIPDAVIIGHTEELKYQLNWKPETRAKVIKEQGSEYYKLLYSAQDKTILDTDTYDQVMGAVDALRTSDATKFFFSPNNPFNERFVREYQLKFKATLNNIDFRCMADLILVDHEKKIIYPIDLKTSSHTEWDFYQSFVQWRYDIQARLYWLIIRYNLDQHPEWKDYTLADYTFIVVNKWTLTPLVWEFDKTRAIVTLQFGKNNQIELEHPFKIASDLKFYLDNHPQVPLGIEKDKPNNIVKWLNTI